MKYIVCIIQSRCKLNSLNWYYKSLYSKIILFDISENGRGNFNSRESFLFSLHTYWQEPVDRTAHHEISHSLWLIDYFLMNRLGLWWPYVVYKGPFWSNTVQYVPLRLFAVHCIMYHNLWSSSRIVGPVQDFWSSSRNSRYKYQQFISLFAFNMLVCFT